MSEISVEERERLIKGMSAGGMSVRGIAKVLGIGKSRVHQILIGWVPARTPKEKHALRLSKYRLSVADYAEMLAGQNEACAICGDAFGERKPFIDHCHTTGKVRGLLCTTCNGGIGMLRDSPTIAANAAEYLRKSAA